MENMSLANMPVTVTKKAIKVDQGVGFVCRFRSSYGPTVVGFDMEWRPNVHSGEDNPADYIPVSLQKFLVDPSFLFCGVGIEADAAKLHRQYSLFVRQFEDVNTLHKRACLNVDPAAHVNKGLKAMVLVVLGKELRKPLYVTLSNWDSEFLTDEQIEYAAIDAFATLLLGIRLTYLISTISQPP
ncbi:3'-5' exonuclease-like [Andrographis paniculata]|uniref:3'-5' exonuclease-like n=1 Tax=Andrographis paniculata TaxID=175694 RepID=UPI0021E7526D|nr:3'-5' exonuclease-like [Andrographis paniculata]